MHLFVRLDIKAYLLLAFGIVEGWVCGLDQFMEMDGGDDELEVGVWCNG